MAAGDDAPKVSKMRMRKRRINNYVIVCNCMVQSKFCNALKSQKARKGDEAVN